MSDNLIFNRPRKGQIGFAVQAAAQNVFAHLAARDNGDGTWTLLANGLWTPASIAGLHLWLDATQITGLADGGAVTTWLDASGQGNDAEQTTAGLKPTYQTNEINGKPIVRFDATDDAMLTPFSLTPPFTIFLVAKPANNSTNRVMSSSVQNAYISPARLIIYAGSCYANGTASLFESTVNTPCIARLRDTGAAISYFVDATDRTSDSTKTLDWGALALGAIGPFPEPAAADVAEVIAYDTALSGGDITLVENYLATKWGITI